MIIWVAFALSIGLPATATRVSSHQSFADGEKLFRSYCGACHTIGGGVVLGPDLAGVAIRRERAWLFRWIKEPDKLLAEGDPVAVDLLKQFNNVPMPNLGLSDRQVEVVLRYLEVAEAGGTTTVSGRPPLYFPTLVAAALALGSLTLVGLLVAKKTVEVRP